MIKKGGATAIAGIVALFGGLLALGPIGLIIVIPLLLLFIGATIYIIATITPFLVAGVMFFITFCLCRKLNVPHPWSVVIPMFFGMVSLFPFFVDTLRSLAVTQVAVSAGVTETEMPSFALPLTTALLIAGFMIFFTIGGNFVVKEDNWSPLGVALVVMAMLMAVLYDCGLVSFATTAGVLFVGMVTEVLVGGRYPWKRVW